MTAAETATLTYHRLLEDWIRAVESGEYRRWLDLNYAARGASPACATDSASRDGHAR